MWRLLALAEAATGDERFAKKASALLRVWFVDETTRMNPNMLFAQYIPGDDVVLPWKEYPARFVPGPVGRKCVVSLSGKSQLPFQKHLLLWITRDLCLGVGNPPAASSKNIPLGGKRSFVPGSLPKKQCFLLTSTLEIVHVHIANNQSSFNYSIFMKIRVHVFTPFSSGLLHPRRWPFFLAIASVFLASGSLTAQTVLIDNNFNSVTVGTSGHFSIKR